MTKQQQKDKAYAEYLAIKEQAFKEYRAIEEPALKEYQSKCDEIDGKEDIKIIDGKKYKLVD